MAKYVALGYKGYDFKNDNGEQLTGATLYYLDEALEQGLMRGFVPFNVTVDLEVAKGIKDFPCVCDIEFKRVPNAKGKAVEVFKSFEYISGAVIKEI